MFPRSARQWERANKWVFGEVVTSLQALAAQALGSEKHGCGHPRLRRLQQQSSFFPGDGTPVAAPARLQCSQGRPLVHLIQPGGLHPCPLSGSWVEGGEGSRVAPGVPTSRKLPTAPPSELDGGSGGWSLLRNRFTVRKHGVTSPGCWETGHLSRLRVGHLSAVCVGTHRPHASAPKGAVLDPPSVPTPPQRRPPSPSGGWGPRDRNKSPSLP